MYPTSNRRQDTSSEELQSTPSNSDSKKKGKYPKSTNDMGKSSAKKISTTTEAYSMGPHHITSPECPKYSFCMTPPIELHRTRRNAKVHRGTPLTRDHRESWNPYATNFFFIKKKDGKLHPVQDY
jgi:hypothetical protein